MTVLRISDHAVLRFIERVHGININALRDEIASLPGLAEGAFAGNERVTVGDAAYVIGFRDDAPTVITIVPADWQVPLPSQRPERAPRWIRGGKPNRHRDRRDRRALVDELAEAD